MTSKRWWEGAALYQVYVRSFADSDGDGYGDLQGLIEHLDYLVSLGVEGVWLSPTTPSPDTDWGYDVSDYNGVHPELGSMEDLEALLKAADQRGLRVLLDIVPNHTSSEHPWFQDALTGRSAAHRDFYVWADPTPGGGPPNNWLDSTGESAWTFELESGQYYLHNFLPSQPDLNWWNPKVHEAFVEILRYWFDKGVAGFRIDVAHGLYKDAELRDNPPATGLDEREARFGYAQVYSANRPETHEVFRQWRRLADSYEPPRLLLGETWVWDIDRLASYCGADDELQLAFNFRFMLSAFDPIELAGVVEHSIAAFGPACTTVWAASNHDVGRMASHWAKGDERRARLALLLLTMLPGTVVLYYGDELAMTDVEVPLELQRDPMTRGGRGGRGARDRGRTPMPWHPGPGAGFTAEAAKPWLPIGVPATGSVGEQEADDASVLWLTRRLLALRRQRLAGSPAYRQLAVAEDRWLFEVGELTVAANFSDRPITFELAEGELLLATVVESPDQAVEGSWTVAPWSGIIVSRQPKAPVGRP